MENVQPQELLQALQAALSPDVELRSRAEAYIQASFKRQGCAVMLLQTATASAVDTGLRQLAAVLLKQLIRKHWTLLNHGSFEEPELSDGEKAAVRAALFTSLWTVPGQVQTSLGVCIAAIAKYDFPDAWPDLLDTLLAVVKTEPTTSQVAEARATGMNTLKLMSEDMDDAQMPAILRVVLPVLVQELQAAPGAPAATPGAPASLLSNTLAVVAACMRTLPMMEPESQAELKAVVKPAVQPLLTALCPVISAALSTDVAASEWTTRLEAVKLAQQLVMGCRKMVAPFVPALTQHCWKLFVDAYPFFERVVLDADDDEGAGELESLVDQLFEFLLTVLETKGNEAAVAALLDPVFYHTIGYMQMTAEQQATWSGDPNQYVADESDEIFGPRATCQLLIETLQSKLGDGVAQAMAAVVRRRLAESTQLRAAGRQSWWRLREAALFVLGTHMASQEDEGAGGAAALDVTPILLDVLNNDLTPPDVPPFLRGRALWVAAKLGSRLPPEQALTFFPAAVAGLGAANAAPVRIGACRAVAALCGKVDGDLLTPHVEALYGNLLELMTTVEPDILNLVLETLQAVIKAHSAAAAHYAGQITAFVVQIFPLHANDMHLSSTIQSLLTAMSKQAACVPAMAREAVPRLLDVLASRSVHLSAVVEGAIDLLCSCVSEDAGVTESIYVAVMPTVIAMLREGPDCAVVQSCTELLRLFVLRGGEAMLTWGGASAAATLQTLHDVVSDVLRPDHDEMAAMFVGGLVLQVLRSFAAHMEPAFPSLLQLLVVKIVACKVEAIRGQLLVVLARMLLELQPAKAVELLSSCAVPGHSSALQAVFGVWMEHALDTQGAFQMRVCALSLSRLLASKLDALSAIQVEGKAPADSRAGVRTRSQAAKASASGGGKPPLVPLPVKLAFVVVQLLKEAAAYEKEQDMDWRAALYGMCGEDDDDDDDDDEDGSDEDDMAGFEADEDVVKGLNAAMMDALGDDEDDEEEEWKGDPLYQADVVELVKNELRGLSKSDAAYFGATLAELSQKDIAYLEGLFKETT